MKTQSRSSRGQTQFVKDQRACRRLLGRMLPKEAKKLGLVTHTLAAHDVNQRMDNLRIATIVNILQSTILGTISSTCSSNLLDQLEGLSTFALLMRDTIPNFIPDEKKTLANFKSEIDKLLKDINKDINHEADKYHFAPKSPQETAHLIKEAKEAYDAQMKEIFTKEKREEIDNAFKKAKETLLAKAKSSRGGAKTHYQRQPGMRYAATKAFTRGQKPFERKGHKAVTYSQSMRRQAGSFERRRHLVMNVFECSFEDAFEAMLKLMTKHPLKLPENPSADAMITGYQSLVSVISGSFAKLKFWGGGKDIPRELALMKSLHIPKTKEGLRLGFLLFISFLLTGSSGLSESTVFELLGQKGGSNAPSKQVARMGPGNVPGNANARATPGYSVDSYYYLKPSEVRSLEVAVRGHVVGQITVNPQETNLGTMQWLQQSAMSVVGMPPQLSADEQLQATSEYARAMAPKIRGVESATLVAPQTKGLSDLGAGLSLRAILRHHITAGGVIEEKTDLQDAIAIAKTAAGTSSTDTTTAAPKSEEILKGLWKDIFQAVATGFLDSAGGEYSIHRFVIVTQSKGSWNAVKEAIGLADSAEVQPPIEYVVVGISRRDQKGLQTFWRDRERITDEIADLNRQIPSFIKTIDTAIGTATKGDDALPTSIKGWNSAFDIYRNSVHSADDKATFEKAMRKLAGEVEGGYVTSASPLSEAKKAKLQPVIDALYEYDAHLMIISDKVTYQNQLPIPVANPYGVIVLSRTELYYLRPLVKAFLNPENNVAIAQALEDPFMQDYLNPETAGFYMPGAVRAPFMNPTLARVWQDKNHLESTRYGAVLGGILSVNNQRVQQLLGYTAPENTRALVALAERGTKPGERNPLVNAQFSGQLAQFQSVEIPRIVQEHSKATAVALAPFANIQQKDLDSAIIAYANSSNPARFEEAQDAKVAYMIVNGIQYAVGTTIQTLIVDTFENAAESADTIQYIWRRANSLARNAAKFAPLVFWMALFGFQQSSVILMPFQPIPGIVTSFLGIMHLVHDTQTGEYTAWETGGIWTSLLLFAMISAYKHIKNKGAVASQRTLANICGQSSITGKFYTNCIWDSNLKEIKAKILAAKDIAPFNTNGIENTTIKEILDTMHDDFKEHRNLMAVAKSQKTDVYKEATPQYNNHSRAWQAADALYRILEILDDKDTDKTISLQTLQKIVKGDILGELTRRQFPLRVKEDDPEPNLTTIKLKVIGAPPPPPPPPSQPKAKGTSSPPPSPKKVGARSTRAQGKTSSASPGQGSGSGTGSRPASPRAQGSGSGTGSRPASPRAQGSGSPRRGSSGGGNKTRKLKWGT